jgi:ParB/RepB/Spo0J family partition protein
MIEAVDVQQIQVSDIKPWDRNPRGARRHDDADEAKLQASIAKDGILQSLVVRPKTDVGQAAGQYLIVCGERRYRAALAVGLLSVPAAVRTLSDADALAIALEENIQRKDMHPLDEADGIASLQAADRALRTPAAVAARIGLPESHVRRRLKLASLGATARKAFGADALTTQQAELLSRLPERLQLEALQAACYTSLFGREALRRIETADWPALRDAVGPVRDLQRWIQDHTVADPRDEAVQEAIPELAGLVKRADDTGGKILTISEGAFEVPKGVLAAGDYRPVTGRVGNKKCDHTERAVVVHAGPTRLVDVCRDKSCAKHWPELQQDDAREPASARRVDPANEKRRQADLAWGKLKRAAMPALIRAIVSNARLTAELVLEALGKYDVKNVQERTGVKLSDATAAAVLALHGIARHPLGSRADLTRTGKRFRFDLAAWEKAERMKTRLVGKTKAAPAKAKARKGRA